MALDDPVVWVLIIGALVFLFGGSKIPGLAKAMGQARREFDMASKGMPATAGNVAQTGPTLQNAAAIPASSADPLLNAAQSEGINTQGKTREEIASELAWKLNKK